MNARIPMLAVIVIFALAGCAASPPPSVSEETSTPSPEPVVAVGVDLAATELTVIFSDETTEQIAFSEPAERFIEVLTSSLGEPEIEEVASGAQCVPAHSVARWGDALSMSWGEHFFYLPPGQSVMVAAMSSGVGSVELGAGAVRVGQPLTTLEGAPGWAERRSSEYEGVLIEALVLDAANGDEEYSSQWGLIASAEDGVITALSAPAPLNGDC